MKNDDNSLSYKELSMKDEALSKNQAILPVFFVRFVRSVRNSFSRFFYRLMRLGEMKFESNVLYTFSV